MLVCAFGDLDAARMLSHIFRTRPRDTNALSASKSLHHAASMPILGLRGARHCYKLDESQLVNDCL